MRAVVTGATGFVGPHLCAHLQAQGDELVDIGDQRAGFDVTDRDAVHAALAFAAPEVVYHLAAAAHVGASWNDPVSFFRVNVEGTQNVLDASLAAGVRRVLVVGSAEEYGRVEQRTPVTEDTPLRPLSPYGASKAAASLVALQHWLGAGLETIRVRTFNHTGPGQAPGYFVPALAERVARAERDGVDDIAIGATDPVRDIADVRDVVGAYRALVEHGGPGEVYNVCTGVGVSIGELARRMLDRSHRRLRLAVDDALVRPADVPWLVGDASRLRTATGWQPARSLDDTLDEMLERARTRLAQGS